MLINVVDRPCLPARPVRPTLWMYSVMFAGALKLITCATLSISIPLATIFVHTRMSACPSLSALRPFSLCSYDFLPWISVTRFPARVKRSCKLSTSAIKLTNTMIGACWCRLRICMSLGLRWLSCVTNSILYSIVFLSPISPIWMKDGHLRYYRAIFSTRGYIVAENMRNVLKFFSPLTIIDSCFLTRASSSALWRCSGIWPMIAFTESSRL